MDQNNLNNQPDNSVAPQPQVEPQPQPVEPTPPVMAMPEPQKPKKSKKPLIIVLIIAVVLALLGGGSALAYNMWYQNPDKVLSDVVSKIASRDNQSGQAKLAVSNDEMKATVDLSNKMRDGKVSVVANADIEVEDMKLKIAGNAVYDKDGTTYVKVDNVSELLDALIDVQLAEAQDGMSAEEQAMMVGMAKAMLQPIVTKVDGQWIKIVPEDLDKNSQSDDEMKCVSQAYKMFSDDKAARDEIYSTYDDHKFMESVENLGSKDGNIGFVYQLNKDTAKQFGEALEQTKVGKKLAECDDDSAKATSTVDEGSEDIKDATVKLEVWANRWSHQLASLKLTVDQEDNKLSLDYTPNYDQDVTVDVPTDAMTVDELTKDLGGLFGL